MRNIPGIIWFLTLFLACDNPETSNVPVNQLQSREMVAAPVQTLRGMFYPDSGSAFFYDCSAGRMLRVISQPPELDSIYRENCQPAPYPGEPVFAVFEGKVSQPAQGEGSLAITRIDTVTARTMHNNCQPHDFWCVGTEPFWGVVISQAEGKISLKQMGESRGRVFPWTTPVQIENAWLYTSTDPASEETIRIQVKKEACSDGMSERQYAYAVEVHLGQQKLFGCAVK